MRVDDLYRVMPALAFYEHEQVHGRPLMHVSWRNLRRTHHDPLRAHLWKHYS